jgi:hypothetical protein
MDKKESALDKQVGGDHYKQFPIQPAEFCHRNNIPYLEATAIKYLCRWRDKGGFADLDKAIHFIELLKEFETTGYPRGEAPTIKLSGEKNVTSTL